LANGDEPRFLDVAAARPSGTVGLAGSGFEVFVHVKELIDTEKLVQKLQKDIERERVFAGKVDAKLANPAFLASAPAEIVEKEREKYRDSVLRAERLARYVEDLT